MAQRLLDATTDACVSFNFSTQSSQHTSTALPPIVTVIAFASSSPSQAAHVFAAVMTPPVNTFTLERSQESTPAATAASKIFSSTRWRGSASDETRLNIDGEYPYAFAKAVLK
jgi:hypothetical protein